MKVVRLISLLFVLLIICSCNRDSSLSIVDRAKLAVPRNDITGLSNFAEISKTLYRGAQPTTEGFRELKKMGVKTIINLRSAHSDRDLIKGLGFQYFNVSFKTWHAEDEDVVKFLKIVTSPEAGVIFVHCQHESDRTGMMTAIYRMYVQRWSRDEAVAELPNFGFHPVWQNIKDYLDDLDINSLRAKVESVAIPKLELIP